MSDVILDQAFQTHAEDYLCSESYYFLREVSTNTKPVNNSLIWGTYARFVSGLSVNQRSAYINSLVSNTNPVNPHQYAERGAPCCFYSTSACFGKLKRGREG